MSLPADIGFKLSAGHAQESLAGRCAGVDGLPNSFERSTFGPHGRGRYLEDLPLLRVGGGVPG
jgi:hypothetical protein